jgi:hypothetical protein
VPFEPATQHSENEPFTPLDERSMSVVPNAICEAPHTMSQC